MSGKQPGLEAMELFLAGRLLGVSAALRPGEVTVICGPNGAGKSTLLQCLAGLLGADGGAVTLDGVPIASLHPRERARAIGYLSQEGEIAWDLSVRNLVALGRLPYGDGGEAQVAVALAALDLKTFSSRPVSTLSGGEKARALLARVLAGEPRWMLQMIITAAPATAAATIFRITSPKGGVVRPLALRFWCRAIATAA